MEHCYILLRNGRLWPQIWMSYLKSPAILGIIVSLIYFSAAQKSHIGIHRYKCTNIYCQFTHDITIAHWSLSQEYAFPQYPLLISNINIKYPTIEFYSKQKAETMIEDNYNDGTQFGTARCRSANLLRVIGLVYSGPQCWRSNQNVSQQ